MLVALADSYDVLAPSDKQRFLPKAERVLHEPNRFPADADLALLQRETLALANSGFSRSPPKHRPWTVAQMNLTRYP
jgi:hypothetical protein